MSHGEIFGILVSCAIAGIIGFAGSDRYSGAHLWAAFTALWVFAGLVQGYAINWMAAFAPLAFAYGAAYVRVAKERGDF